MGDSGRTANEEIVSQAFALFSARDAEGLVALTDPDGVMFPFSIEERRPDGYEGHDGLRRYMRDIDTIFERFEVDLTEVRDVGDGAVMVEGRMRGRTRDGRTLDMATSWLWTVGPNGLITQMQAHPAGRPT